MPGRHEAPRAVVFAAVATATLLFGFTVGAASATASASAAPSPASAPWSAPASGAAILTAVDPPVDPVPVPEPVPTVVVPVPDPAPEPSEEPQPVPTTDPVPEPQPEPTVAPAPTVAPVPVPEPEPVQPPVEEAPAPVPGDESDDGFVDDGSDDTDTAPTEPTIVVPVPVVPTETPSPSPTPTTAAVDIFAPFYPPDSGSVRDALPIYIGGGTAALLLLIALVSVMLSRLDILRIRRSVAPAGHRVQLAAAPHPMTMDADSIPAALDITAMLPAATERQAEAQEPLRLDLELPGTRAADTLVEPAGRADLTTVFGVATSTRSAEVVSAPDVALDLPQRQFAADGDRELELALPSGFERTSATTSGTDHEGGTSSSMRSDLRALMASARGR